MDGAEFRVDEVFGGVGAFGPWGLDAHLARGPLMAAASEWTAALKEEHQATFTFEFPFILDDPALEILRGNVPLATRHQAFPIHPRLHRSGRHPI